MKGRWLSGELRKELGRDKHNILKTILLSLSRNHWWETLDQMVKGVCLNSLVYSRSKSVKLAFSKSQQYKALFSFSLFNKLVNTLMFTFPCAVARQCHQR